jgi:hypothetical protein
MSQKLRQRMFTVGVELFLAPQVRNQHLMLIMRMLHQHKSVIWLYNVNDSAWLACVHSLQKSYTFTHLKELMQQSSLHFDRDWDLFLGLKLDDTCVGVDVLYDALTTLELA